MSIINDALKKTQANIEKNKKNPDPSLYEKAYNESDSGAQTNQKIQTPQQTPQQVQKPQTPIAQASPQNKNLKTIFITSFILLPLFLIVIAVLLKFVDNKGQSPFSTAGISLPFGHKKISSKETIKKVTPLRKDIPATTPAPIQKSISTQSTAGSSRPEMTNSLHLSGIMMMGELNVAIINDDIYKVGETIAGLTITDITLKQVHLSDGKNNYVLDVRESR